MSLLQRIVDARFNGGASDTVEDAPTKSNPMLLSLLRSFGVSPEMIEQFANDFKGAIVGKLESIDNRLMCIEERLTMLEANQSALLHDQAEEMQTATMIANVKNACTCPTHPYTGLKERAVADCPVHGNSGEKQ